MIYDNKLQKQKGMTFKRCGNKVLKKFFFSFPSYKYYWHMLYKIMHKNQISNETLIKINTNN